MEKVFFKSYESYFSDQFIARDYWVKAYTLTQLRLPVTYVNGFYITKDNYILHEPVLNFPKEELDKAAFETNQLASFLQTKQTKFYFFPYPSKNTMTVDLLPSYAPKGRAKENKEYFLSKLDKRFVSYEDLGKTFENTYSLKERKTFYFNTDHHWNIKGAFRAYQLVMERISHDFSTIPTDYESSSYDFQCTNGKRFVGSWNKQLFSEVSLTVDKPCHYIPKQYSFNEYVVYKKANDQKSKAQTNMIYDQASTTKQEKVDYGSSYSADLGELTIINPTSQNKLKTLIIKDSYSNATIYHMAHHFSETTFYDMRHNNKHTLYDYLKTHHFDIVILAYNDTNLTGNMFNFSSVLQP